MSISSMLKILFALLEVLLSCTDVHILHDCTSKHDYVRYYVAARHARHGS